MSDKIFRYGAATAAVVSFAWLCVDDKGFKHTVDHTIDRASDIIQKRVINRQSDDHENLVD